MGLLHADPDPRPDGSVGAGRARLAIMPLCERG